jgi:hypothetical protein
MIVNSQTNPASNDELGLYTLLGESLCNLQFLEDALSHSIALKKDIKVPYSIPREQGDKLVREYRKLTLGQAIKLAKQEGLYSDSLLAELQNFLLERNWLIHRSVYENIDQENVILGKDKFFTRISAVGKRTVFNGP